MPDLVLATLNARYAHTSFALRYLMANLGTLRAQARMMEFEIKHHPAQVAREILAGDPRIVGLGVYIWNAGATREVVRLLKQARPEVVVILGGPEVSHEVDQQEICALADYVITGEADTALPLLCRQILDGRRPPARVIAAPPVDVAQLALPYALYSDEDLAHRIVYVEASRGCPFTCEFCLSSLDVPLRRFPLEALLPQLQTLLDRGLRHFKFVDRTFNLSIRYSLQLLEFFLARYQPGLFLHFEMIPDRLPEELRTIIRAFPRGVMQLEVGIQTFNEAVAARIRRRQDYAKTEENLRFLMQETGAYIHADLIFGLPGESMDSFAAGFDRLLALRPHEIQVNRLKRLRGTPIVRHSAEWDMVYREEPPYDVIANRLIDAAGMDRLQRFGKFWDLYANSGNFIESTPLLWQGRPSPFAAFMAFSEWLHAGFGRTHSLALEDLAERLHRFLTTVLGQNAQVAAKHIWNDYQRGAPRDMPVFLREYLDYENHRAAFRPAADRRVKRQARRQ